MKKLSTFAVIRLGLAAALLALALHDKNKKKEEKTEQSCIE